MRKVLSSFALSTISWVENNQVITIWASKICLKVGLLILPGPWLNIWKLFKHKKGSIINFNKVLCSSKCGNITYSSRNCYLWFSRWKKKWIGWILSSNFTDLCFSLECGNELNHKTEDICSEEIAKAMSLSWDYIPTLLEWQSCWVQSQQENLIKKSCSN